MPARIMSPENVSFCLLFFKACCHISALNLHQYHYYSVRETCLQAKYCNISQKDIYFLDVSSNATDYLL